MQAPLNSCISLVSVQQLKTPSIIIVYGLLIIINLFVIIGNLMVVVVISRNKELQTVNTILIMSLAVADLSVGIFVLPFSSVNQVLQVWIFGPAWCQIWLSLDVWMCTASIYHLVAISLDRLIAVTKPLTYPIIMTPSKGAVLVCLSWLISLLISLPPILQIPLGFQGLRKSRNSQSILELINNHTTGMFLYQNVTIDESKLLAEACRCTPMDNDPIYIIVSAVSSFYLPTLIIILTYARIYRIVRISTSQYYQGQINIRLHDDHEGGRTSQTQKRGTMNQESVLLSALRRLMHHFGWQISPQTNEQITEPQNSHKLINKHQDRKNSTLALRIHKGCGKLPGPRPRPTINTFTLGSRRRDSHHRAREPTGYQNDHHAPTKPLMAQRSRKLSSFRHRTHFSPQSNSSTKRRHSSLDVSQQASSTTSTASQNQSRSSMSVDNLNAHADCITEETHHHQCFSMRARTTRYIKRLQWEIEAMKSVSIVTGLFLTCWMGFAVVYTMNALPKCQKKTVCISGAVTDVLFWLGYCNSAINPIIYVLFNRQFRQAFQRIHLKRRRLTAYSMTSSIVHY